MPNFVTMPKLSDTMTEGTLVKWLVKVGDTVDVGDPLAEIETDKATMEMVAFDEGTVGELYVSEGTKAPLGENLAILLEEGDELPPRPESAAANPVAEQEETEGTENSVAGDAVPGGAKLAATTASGERIKASPLARKIAAAEGIDLTTIQGSGPGGRIVKKDLAGAATGAPVAPVAAPGTPAPSPAQPGTPPPATAIQTPAAVPSIPPGEGDQRLPLNGMRTIIAERLLASKTQIPHFYLHIEVDAEPLMTLRKQANAAVDAGGEGNKFTVNDFVLKAVANAAAAVPAVNASFAGDAIIQYGSVQLSVAIAIDEGLVTPVIRDAQDKSLLEISLAVKDLAARAKSKKLSPDEFAGGTLTVSNLGGYGIDRFDAIINPPQAMILAVGAIVKKPVVDPAGNIVAGLRMDIGLSGDHRVVDGAVGAEYLAAFKKLIENPASMLV